MNVVVNSDFDTQSENDLKLFQMYHFILNSKDIFNENNHKTKRLSVKLLTRQLSEVK